MRVIGQFNLGFIVTQLGPDLFIIDQHASDEKFQFETLQRTTVIHEQRLIRPLPVEITAAEEMVIMDNLDTFRTNGFHFDVQWDAPPTQRLRLTAVPFTKHTQFGPQGALPQSLSSLLSAPVATFAPAPALH